MIQWDMLQNAGDQPQCMDTNTHTGAQAPASTYTLLHSLRHRLSSCHLPSYCHDPVCNDPQLPGNRIVSFSLSPHPLIFHLPYNSHSLTHSHILSLDPFFLLCNGPPYITLQPLYLLPLHKFSHTFPFSPALRTNTSVLLLSLISSAKGC